MIGLSMSWIYADATEDDGALLLFSRKIMILGAATEVTS
jgi:hypothetical protein